MKTFIITLSLVAALATRAWAQGYVSITALPVVIVGGGVTNKTGTAASSFYYDVLINSSTVTTIDSSLQGLTAAGWSDSGITGVNGTGALGAGKITAVNTASSVWAPGAEQAFVVIGWSGSLGSTWAQLEAALAGAHFQPGLEWSGLSGAGGLVGYTTVGSAIAGPDSGTAAQLFNSTSSAQVPVPVTTSLVLYPIAPEPGALALAGLGVATLLSFRLRKTS
jgi:hypothetical protein